MSEDRWVVNILTGEVIGCSVRALSAFSHMFAMFPHTVSPWRIKAATLYKEVTTKQVDKNDFALRFRDS